jgi:IS605 OrfB family transposase
MKIVRTYKLKIISENPKFLETSTNYLKAANWLSNIIYQRKKPSTAPSLSKEFYATVRENFNLPSQLTCSLFRHVVSTYCSMKSNRQWSLAIYKKINIPICWKRDFNISKSKGLTIWGIKTSYKSRKLPEGKWLDSKLKLIKGNWYILLSIEIDMPELKETGSIIGVDSGIKNILTATDKKSNKTIYISGSNLNHKRLRIRQIKAKVASVGTQSAKRLLKRLSGKEKAVTRELLHIASKQLVTFAESVNAKTIVMEDLIGIRKGKKVEYNKKKRARNHRWPFAQCQFYISYKANVKGIRVEYVSPAYTSQSCCVCGHTEETNRKGLIFRCKSCGYQDNADRVGSINIGLRLILQRQGVEERAVYQSAYSNDEGKVPVNYKPNDL